MGLLFLPLMFALLYFVLIRPQQRRARAQQVLQRAVEVGDEVLTTSGLYGIVTAMDDDDLWLEVAEGVEIRMARGAVLRRTQATTDAPETPAPADDAEKSHDEKK